MVITTPINRHTEYVEGVTGYENNISGIASADISKINGI